MTRVLAAALLVCGCGPAEPTLGFDVSISALTQDIGSLQISILTRGSKIDCDAVTQNCLVTQFPADRFVRVKDAAGTEHQALTFPLNLKPSGANSAQDVSVQGIPVGKDYAVVIEALSKKSPPELAGSSCTFISEINPGLNPTAVANVIKPPTVPLACDPRIEK